MLAQAKKNGVRGTVRGRSEDLPFSDASHDLVLCVHAFHHFKEQEKSVDEMFRVLAPGGRVFFEDLDASRNASKIITFVENLLGDRVRCRRAQEMAQCFTATGFEVVWQGRNGISYSFLLLKNTSTSSPRGAS